jgi:hypothetical protein
MLFKGNEIVETVILPVSTERIGRQTFAGCKSLGKVSMYNTVKRIDERAFEGCDSLRKIFIPIGCSAKFQTLLEERLWEKIEEVE